MVKYFPWVLLAIAGGAAASSESPVVDVGAYKAWQMLQHRYAAAAEEGEAIAIAATASNSQPVAIFAVSCRDYGKGKGVYFEIHTEDTVRLHEGVFTAIAARVDQGPISEFPCMVFPNAGGMTRLTVAKPLSDEDIAALIRGARLYVQLQRPSGTYSTKTFSLMGFTRTGNWVVDQCRGGAAEPPVEARPPIRYARDPDPFGGYRIKW